MGTATKMRISRDWKAGERGRQRNSREEATPERRPIPAVRARTVRVRRKSWEREERP